MAGYGMKWDPTIPDPHKAIETQLALAAGGGKLHLLSNSIEFGPLERLFFQIVVKDFWIGDIGLFISVQDLPIFCLFFV
jgi:hypothetical protein